MMYSQNYRNLALTVDEVVVMTGGTEAKVVVGTTGVTIGGIKRVLVVRGRVGTIGVTVGSIIVGRTTGGLTVFGSTVVVGIGLTAGNASAVQGAIILAWIKAFENIRRRRVGSTSSSSSSSSGSNRSGNLRICRAASPLW